MMNTVVAEAAARGLREVYGYYYPTAKNGMVRDFYAGFGFTKVREDENGDTVWKLDVETYRPKALHMKVKR